MLISLMLRTNYVIRVMRIKDKGGRKINKISKAYNENGYSYSKLSRKNSPDCIYQ
jgi:hypothetical protein